MSGLAYLLLTRGCRVSGSDLKETPLTFWLKKEGAEILLGHRKENVKEAEVLVYSSCIQKDNPERREALRRGLSILSRGELLSLLFHEKKFGIAISGSHGKTTTTALTAWLLHQAGREPSYLIGGISHNLGGNTGAGQGDYFVTEADESDGSFLALDPTYALVTNMDAEHLDYYGTLEKSLEAYTAFLNKTEEDGKIFISADCPDTARILSGLTHPHCVTFGLSRLAHYHPDRIERLGESSCFVCVGYGTPLGTFRLPLPGLHNIANSVGVIALGHELGIPISMIQKSLESFQGVERRMEVTRLPSLTIVEDYAHHPTEIKATLEALKGMAQGRRIVGVFQPHRYSRTQLLAKCFGDCFQEADFLIITDIYPANEAPLPGVDAELILREVRAFEKNKEVLYLRKEEIIPHLFQILRPDDILIVMGAGDVNDIAKEMAHLCLEGALSWIHTS